MQCSFSAPLTDEELLIALDGEAAVPILEHLAQCAGCTERLEQMREAEHMLETQLHPSPEQIGHYHIQMLTDKQHKILSNHLKVCAFCRSDYETLKSFLETDPPETGTNTLDLPPLPRRMSNVHKITMQVAQTQLRGSSLRGTSRQITRTAEGLMLNLDIRSSGAKRVAVQGRIVALEQSQWTNALLTLRQAGVVCGTAILNEKGIFSLDATANAAEPFDVRVDSEAKLTIALDGL